MHRRAQPNKELYPYDEKNQCYMTVDGVPVRKLYVGNISRFSTDEDVKNIFSSHGKVEDVSLMRKGVRDKGSLYGFVTFHSAQDAAALLKKPIGIHLKKLRVTIFPADTWHQPRAIEKPCPEADVELENDETIKQDFEKCPISRLNDDCLLLIFDMLSSPTRITLGQVCKRWRALNSLHWENMKSLNFTKPPYEIVPLTRLETYLNLCSNLKSLTVSQAGTIQNINVLVSIAKHCKLLEEVTLLSVNIERRCLALLGQSCPHLKSINLESCPLLNDHELSVLLRKSENLEHLRIKFHSRSRFLGHDSKQPGNWLSYLKEPLKSLSLERFTIHSRYLFEGLKKVPGSLRCLALKSCSALKSSDVMMITSTLPKLESLEFENSTIHLTQESLLTITTLKELKSLNLSRCPIVNNTFLTTLVEKCPELQVLRLTGVNNNNITTQGLSVIPNLSKLTHLGLGCVYHVSDELLISISKKLKQLKILELESCGLVSDKGILEIITNCVELEKLDVRGCSLVTDCTVLSAIELFSDGNRKKLHILAGASGVSAEDWFADPDVMRLLNIDLESVPSMLHDIMDDLSTDEDDDEDDDDDDFDDYDNDSDFSFNHYRYNFDLDDYGLDEFDLNDLNEFEMGGPYAPWGHLYD